MSKTQSKMAIRTTSKSINMEYEVMFDRTIESPSEFQEELYTMRQANEGDLVNLRINSGGGQLVTFTAVSHLMKNSSAHFHAILEGDASSAASMLFLIADSQEVADHSEMMIHTAQVGYSSHSQGFKGSADMMAYQSERLIREVYEDFLSEDEIHMVLNGGEIWLHSDQIRERLDKRQSIRDQKHIAEMKEEFPFETYAKKVIEDIKEDCLAFEYNVEEMVKCMLTLVSTKDTEVSKCEQVPYEEQKQPRVLLQINTESFGIFCIREDGEIINSCNEVVPYSTKGFTDVYFIDFLKEAADSLGVKYSHNISVTKLCERLNKKVQEIIDNHEDS